VSHCPATCCTHSLGSTEASLPHQPTAGSCRISTQQHLLGAGCLLSSLQLCGRVAAACAERRCAAVHLYVLCVHVLARCVIVLLCQVLCGCCSKCLLRLQVQFRWA
jgi:hypothetical protein